MFLIEIFNKVCVNIAQLCKTRKNMGAEQDFMKYMGKNFNQGKLKQGSRKYGAMPTVYTEF